MDKEKEREILLDRREIEKLLQGSLHWSDVAHRMDKPGKRSSIRRLGDPLPPRHTEQPSSSYQNDVNSEKRGITLPTSHIAFPQEETKKPELNIKLDIHLESDIYEESGTYIKPVSDILVETNAETGHSDTSGVVAMSARPDNLEAGEPWTVANNGAGVIEKSNVFEGKGVVFLLLWMGLITFTSWIYFVFPR